MGVDWGSVPVWFSVILSGASVLMALRIILRDRKNEERADAMKVLCWPVARPSWRTDPTESSAMSGSWTS
jgi:hypothetical protein